MRSFKDYKQVEWGINPIPVMGKDALKAYLREFFYYAEKNNFVAGTNFTNYSDTCVQTYYIEKKNEFEWNADSWGPFKRSDRHIRFEPGDKHHGNITSILERIDLIDLCQNCAFRKPWYKVNEEISVKRKKEIENIIHKLNNMIYERSALLYHGVFGNYSL